MKKRRLKIYPKYVSNLSIGVFRPEIRLCGKWLEDAGFKPGYDIQVSYDQDKIIIEKIR
jgi:toxic protein SymE